MQKGSLVAAVKQSTSCYSPSHIDMSLYRKHWSVGDPICHMFCGVCCSRGTKGCVYILFCFYCSLRFILRGVFFNNAFLFSSAVLTFRVEAANDSQIFGSDVSLNTHTKTINVRPEIVTTLMNCRICMLW